MVKQVEFVDKPKMEEEYEGFIITQKPGQQSQFLEVKAKVGRLPDVLAGAYTSLSKAQAQIDIWNRTKAPRVKQNGKD